MSTYTPTALAALLRVVTAPTWAERHAADNLLWLIISSAQTIQPNHAFDTLWNESITLLADARADLFRSACVFWLDLSSVVFSKRMASFKNASIPDWQSCADAADLPQDEIRVGSFDLFGLGIGAALQREAHRLTELAPLWLAGLSHPEPMTSDCCWNMLGAAPEFASRSLPTMLQYAFERGTHFAPGGPMRVLAKLIREVPQGMQILTDEITASKSKRRFETLHAIADQLGSLSETLCSWLEKELASCASADERYEIYCSLVRSSTKSRRNISGLLQTALSWSTSEVSEERSAAAWGFTGLGPPEQYVKQLVSLLGDADWCVRSNAAAACRQWPSAPAELIHAVAKLISDYDGYDGYPAANAVSTLANWGVASKAALPDIKAWISESDSEISADALTLLEAIGPDAYALSNTIEAAIYQWYGTEELPLDETDAAEHEDEDVESSEADQSGMFQNQLIESFGTEFNEEFSALAAEMESELGLNEEFLAANNAAKDALINRLGISANDHIPGTEVSELNDSDTEEKLRYWLEKARAAA